MAWILVCGVWSSADEGDLKPKPSKDEDAKPKVSKEAKPKPPADYAQQLREANVQEKTETGLKVQVSLIPDALRYYVAQDFVTLKKGGYEKEELIQKLRETYTKHRGKKDALLILVSLKDGGPVADDEIPTIPRGVALDIPRHFPRFFLLREGVALASVQQGKSKKDPTWLKDDSPKPSYEPWKVHIYETNKATAHPRYSLALLESQDLIYCRYNFNANSKEPIKVTVRNVWTQRRSFRDGWLEWGGAEVAGSHRNSINVGTKEVSCTGVKSLDVPPVEMEFLPGAMSLPEPPEGFSEIFDALKGK